MKPFNLTNPYQAPLDNQLAGKTIEHVFTDGEHLILKTTDNYEVCIGWVEGEPIHVKTNVRIVLPAAGAMGGVTSF